jgi:cytochrome c553
MKQATMLLAAGVVLVAMIGTRLATGQDIQAPAWAYPLQEPGRDRPADDGTLWRTPDSELEFTWTQINDRFNPPDWYPNEHPSMPEIVAHGRPPRVRACAQCHMPHGMGHPESSSLAGLSANYIVQQMRDYKSGARTSLDGRRYNTMAEIVADMTDEEMQISAEYFAALPPVAWVSVIEAETVPQSYVGAGNMRHAEPDAGTEPIGMRIIELPEDSHRAELRDSHSGFVAYVPPGSVAAGRELATTGAGRTLQCALCHGPDLRGVADIPGIAGRSPIYTARQLWDIKTGARNGPMAALMHNVVANLTDEDILNLSAYAASLEP